MADKPNSARSAVLADRIFDGRRWHERAALLSADGRILGVCSSAEVPADCIREHAPADAMLVPGFVDVQVNGGGGVLLNDQPTPEGLRAIARAHRKLGTTSLLPTLITDTREQMAAAIAAARIGTGTDGVLGVHLEGPYISPARPGIHRKDRIARAQMSDVEGLRDLPGRSLVTLAPECVPTGFVRALVSAGARVCVGHSEASAEVVSDAIAEGLTGVTHLYNAMPPLMARAPGIVGAALADDRLTAGLIVDGSHVDPIAVRAAFAAKGSDRIMLVSDAMPTVGGASTQFQLLGRTISLKDGKLTAEDGTLAGAHLDMASAVRNAVRFGISLDDALRSATLTPARLLGFEAEIGALVAGARADFVVLSKKLEVLQVWAAGTLIDS